MLLEAAVEPVVGEATAFFVIFGIRDVAAPAAVDETAVFFFLCTDDAVSFFSFMTSARIWTLTGFKPDLFQLRSPHFDPVFGHAMEVTGDSDLIYT